MDKWWRWRWSPPWFSFGAFSPGIENDKTAMTQRMGNERSGGRAVLHVHNLDGDDANPGSVADPVQSIEAALELAEDGDAIRVVVQTEPTIRKLKAIVRDCGCHGYVEDGLTTWAIDCQRMRDILLCWRAALDAYSNTHNEGSLEEAKRHMGAAFAHRK